MVPPPVDLTRDTELLPWQFPKTRWSRILVANGQGAGAEQALNELCRQYWYPLYAFVRRQGKSPEDAQDLTQGFFEDFLRHETLERANREKGRLRSFLLGGIKNYMASEHRRAMAGKRGGGMQAVPLDEGHAESLYLQEPDADQSPDRLFERRWALGILDRVIEKLGKDYSERGLQPLFEQLGPHLAGQRECDYTEIAANLDTSAGAVRTAMSRMRKRYRKFLVMEIAETVASPDMIDEELESLIAVLRGT